MTGSPKIKTARSGISARTPRSTRAPRSAPRAPGPAASMAPSPATSCRLRRTPGHSRPPAPHAGQTSSQQYLACEAQEMAEVVDLDTTVEVPAGSYTGCLKTSETTPLEPTVVEEKYYCPGVGVALSIDQRH